MSKRMAIAVLAVLTVSLGPLAPSMAQASQHMMSRSGASSATSMMGPDHIAEGLMMPEMNPGKGRQLFVSKGCIVCHAVNGIGGEDARPLDASTMQLPMNPFEFAAKMWRGAEAMITLQREELGEQIELTGQELADIIAFTHSKQEQRKLTAKDIPPKTWRLIEHNEKEGGAGHHKK